MSSSRTSVSRVLPVVVSRLSQSTKAERNELVQRIGNLVAIFFVGAGEFLLAAIAYGIETRRFMPPDSSAILLLRLSQSEQIAQHLLDDRVVALHAKKAATVAHRIDHALEHVGGQFAEPGRWSSGSCR